MLLNKLPKTKGSYRENADLSKTNWFGVGGRAEILFRPEDSEDLAFFLANKPKDIKTTIIGVGSNILIRDGGIEGVVIKLGRNFTNIELKNDIIEVGAACLNFNLAHFALENERSGLEFYVGIPGCVGGALAMNAGAYGSDTSTIFEKAIAIDEYGDMHQLNKDDMGFIHRGNTLPDNFFFIKAFFKTTKGNKEEIKQKMDDINTRREATQPIKSKTCGSTFSYPKAWELIDKAGCRGLRIGGAMVSEKHCNFLINENNATASDLENLGEEVRKRVLKETGIWLEWEIKIIGKKPCNVL